MKLSLVNAVLLGLAQAEEGAEDDDWEMPAEAFGEFVTSENCMAGDYCVFSVSWDADTDTWTPSVCGAEADCMAEESDGEESDGEESDGEDDDMAESGTKTFCLEFIDDKEDSSIKLAASMAAAFTALALSL